MNSFQTIPRIDPRTARRPGVLAVAMAAILMTLVTAVSAQDTSPASQPEATDLPTAADLIDKHIEARGGADAIKRHRSATLKGTLTVPGASYTRDFTEHRMARSKYRVILSWNEMPEREQCYDGKVGWTVDSGRGARLVKGIELKLLKRQADFHADLHYGAAHKTMETVEETTFEGEPCYKIRLVDQSDIESFEYFSVQSGLRKGVELNVPTGGHGALAQKTTIEAYEAFDGVLVPVKYTTTAMRNARTITITDVEFDAVDASVFDQSAVVKQLIESERRTTPDQ